MYESAKGEAPTFPLGELEVFRYLKCLDKKLCPNQTLIKQLKWC